MNSYPECEKATTESASRHIRQEEEVNAGPATTRRETQKD